MGQLMGIIQVLRQANRVHLPRELASSDLSSLPNCRSVMAYFRPRVVGLESTVMIHFHTRINRSIVQFLSLNDFLGFHRKTERGNNDALLFEIYETPWGDDSPMTRSSVMPRRLELSPLECSKIRSISNAWIHYATVNKNVSRNY